MGLFSKTSPGEKKLKELIGGFLLNSEFQLVLERWGIKQEFGYTIQRYLKDDIKRQNLTPDEVPNRIHYYLKKSSDCLLHDNTPTDGNYTRTTSCSNCGKEYAYDLDICPYCNHDSSQVNVVKIKNNNVNYYDTKKCPSCGKSQAKENSFCIDCGYSFEKLKTCPMCDEKQDEDNRYCISCGYDFNDSEVKRHTSTVKKHTSRIKNPVLEEFKRKTAFLSNYTFNTKTCPECNTVFLKTDPFCFNCGASVVTQETVKNENLKVKDGKFVADDTNQNSKLSELEALYKQTVKSKYAPVFKVGYVLYLDEFRKNPNKKFNDNFAKKYETTLNKLEKQAKEDNFIEPAPPIVEAKKSKVSDLKEILKEHNLKVSGKKDELIERLSENLTEDELKKYFKSKNFQISQSGVDFINQNKFILYIFKNNDLSKAINPVDISKIYEEKEYDDDEIKDKLLVYLKRMLDDKLTSESWFDFKILSNAIAQVQEDKNELHDALNTRFKVFLFDINNFDGENPNPRTTRLRQKDVVNLVNLLHKLTLPINELKESFENAYDEVLFKMIISKDDALIYLLKVFGGEDLDSISQEINEDYSNPY